MEDTFAKFWRFALVSTMLLHLFACGGGHDHSQQTPEEPQAYRIGGTVSGLSGSGLVLQNNGGDDLTIDSRGAFSFPTRLTSGSDYLITIATQPGGQNCTIANGGGTVAQSDVTQVVVSCPLEAVTPEVSAAGAKLLRFAWNDVGADYYKLLKNPDGQSGYTQVGDDITGTQVDETISVHLTDWVNASYLVQACNSADLCSDSVPLSIISVMISTIGYLKAPDISTTSVFGDSVALSNDATTLAVESSAGVHIFLREGVAWRQQTLIDISCREVLLAGDGNTLATTHPFDNSSATGINGDESDDGAQRSGAVRVFTRNGDSWSQQAYIKASNSESEDRFGQSIAFSSDGNILAVGAPNENSSTTGINGNQADNSAYGAGAAYLFIREDGSWRQQAYIKASNTESDDQFGESIALSSDGNTLAVGAPYEDSSATGVGGNQADDSAYGAGAAYLFIREDGSWRQQAYIKASNSGRWDWFGYELSLSGRGNVLAVSAIFEDSSATGIDGDQTDSSDSASGAVYLFGYQAGTWAQTAYIKASNTDNTDMFGDPLALSYSGNILAVGAKFEDSIASGINGDQSDNSAIDAGAVYIFSHDGGPWHQQAYVKASNTDSGELSCAIGSSYCLIVNALFGNSLALSGNGDTLVVGALRESSQDQTDQWDLSEFGTGAVYLY